jgi:hypothetical protein
VGWRDRAIGIVLGVVLGAGVVTAFVFVLSDETVDAPSLSGEAAPAPDRVREGDRGARGPGEDAPPVATIRVVGGAPPPGGPAELRYRRGEEIRVRVISDSALELQVTGYGVRWTVPPSQSGTRFSLRASRTGTFAVIVTGSHIDVARITVTSGN